MARDVHNILLKVVMEKGKMSEMEAVAYIKKMDSQKRYSTDVWSWSSCYFHKFVKSLATLSLRFVS